MDRFKRSVWKATVLLLGALLFVSIFSIPYFDNKRIQSRNTEKIGQDSDTHNLQTSEELSRSFPKQGYRIVNYRGYEVEVPIADQSEANRIFNDIDDKIRNEPI